MTEQTIKIFEGPTLWEEFVRHMKGFCLASEGKFNFDSPSRDEVLVATKRDRLSLTYRRDASCVHYEMTVGSGYLTFRANAEGPPLQFLYNGIPYRAEDMVAAILLKMRR